MLLNIDDYQLLAKQRLEPSIYDYFAGGAEDEVTLAYNRSALTRIKLLPRVLAGGFDGKLNGYYFGVDLKLPIIASPTAFHCLASANGERATAEAVHAAGSMMIISMAATQTLETIMHRISKEQPARFALQLYLQPDREFNLAMIERAAACHCCALVISVDSPVFGRRWRDMRHQFYDLPPNMECANMRLPGEAKARNIVFDATLSWDDIAWLRQATRLPIILKGIMHPADAKLALACGVDGIFVSNHGGRQLDHAVATIAALPGIVQEVSGQVPIIIDGGFRRGTDILKALALGANLIAIGRPIVWGLAVADQAGVAGVLKLLEEELVQALQLCGCSALQELNDSFIFQEG